MTEVGDVALIGLAGASGVGKSSVARGIQALYPEIVEVVHFDDFQKSNDEIIRCLGSIANWDDPEVTDFEDAFCSLSALKAGQEAVLQVKNEFDNPGFIFEGKYERFAKIIHPKEVVIVEGHYVLYDERVRRLFDMSLFLKGDVSVSTARRTKGTDHTYNQTYLLPMFEEHIVPTEMHADCVIEVDGLNAQQVLDATRVAINSRLGLLGVSSPFNSSGSL